MSKIRLVLKAESGEDLRNQLLVLLGQSVKISGADIVQSIKRSEVKTIAPEAISDEQRDAVKEALTKEVKAAEEKPKRSRTTKKVEETPEVKAEETPEVKAEETPEVKAEETPEVKAEETPGDAAAEITFDTIKTLTLQAGQEGKKDKAIKVLASLGVEKISHLEENQYATYHAQITKILNGK